MVSHYFLFDPCDMKPKTYSLCSYLGDKEATEAALDRDGYFKTGDFGRKLGDEFFVDGRVSRDCKCYKMSQTYKTH